MHDEILHLSSLAIIEISFLVVILVILIKEIDEQIQPIIFGMVVTFIVWVIWVSCA